MGNNETVVWGTQLHDVSPCYLELGGCQPLQAKQHGGGETTKEVVSFAEWGVGGSLGDFSIIVESMLQQRGRGQVWIDRIYAVPQCHRAASPAAGHNTTGTSASVSLLLSPQ